MTHGWCQKSSVTVPSSTSLQLTVRQTLKECLQVQWGVQPHSFSVVGLRLSLLYLIKELNSVMKMLLKLNNK